MTSQPPDPADSSTWPPLDTLAPGFDAFKAEASAALDGREVVVAGEHRTTYRFQPDHVTWRVEGQPQNHDGYEAFDVDDDLHYVQLHRADAPYETVALVLDFALGYALTINTTIGDERVGRTRARQSFVTGGIEGTAQAGPAPAPTTDLVGKRVLWEYSAAHAYEHIYLSPRRYTWQCLAGPEKGLADTDENSTYQLRPGIYVFTWRERVIPCAAVTIADHRYARGARSHGALFGLDDSGSGCTLFTFGAWGRLLSNTVHPAPYDPASWTGASEAGEA